MDYSPLLIVACAVLLGWWITRQVRTYNVSTSPPRPDRHIPADEYRLLGDDWREPAADFFAESFIRSTRRRFAVMAVTGADPEKTEPAAVGRPGSTTDKELSHARTRK